MRVPVSWLRELVPAAAAVDVDALGELAVGRGLEVEEIHRAKVSGPLVIGRILSSEPEPQKNGKTIRWCSVDVGESTPRGIVCGAPNAVTGALVVVSLPGAVLPGGFAIAARKTYGHVSDGMICSERELGLGEGHDGILALDDAALPAAVPGAPAAGILGLGEEVIEFAVTPDRGYCLSMRGVAREIAGALGVPFDDPASPASVPTLGPTSEPGLEVRLDDSRCPYFTRFALEVDPAVPSPDWLRARLVLAGFRPISLVVDVTNYVLVELGQPTHAYDLDALAGPIVVRAARPGERLRTLDGAARDLDPEDLLITDATGPIGLAGVMGGEATEISGSTTRILVEAAGFDPVSVARTVRRHKLPSEASRRFERGVDPALSVAAAVRIAQLLTDIAGARPTGGAPLAVVTAGAPTREPAEIKLPAQLPARIIGRAIGDSEVVAALREIGAHVERLYSDLTVTPPTWRPDLTDPYDLVEEVARVVGYDTVPSRLRATPPGPGLSLGQRQRRAVVAALVGDGLVESPSYPFVSASSLDVLGIAADDDRRRLVRISNPISGTEPFLRTTLLPGLLGVARRNIGRGSDGGAAGLGLFDIGPVVLGSADAAPLHAPRPSVLTRPSEVTIKELFASLPRQPRHLAVVLTGDRDPGGWWGPGRAAGWLDAIAAVEVAAAALGVDLSTAAAQVPPWHPGRCAAVWAGPVLIGHAGELHPRVCAAYDLPPRAVAAEIDLDALLAAAPVAAVPVSPSGFPVAKVDLALVVAAEVGAAEVATAIRAGIGGLLESLVLFDVYTGEQIPDGRRSLAFALRLRAPDRTLSDAEVQSAVAGAVAAAGTATGAVLRS